MENLSANFLALHLKKYVLFQEQNPKTGRFDVTFEVEGKLLYAHKTMLTLNSDTFHSMLSHQEIKKDVPIKIQDYLYDDFYQFLAFLYYGRCELTDSNIFSMIDIAELYGVQLFEDYCKKYLSSMEITTQNIFQLIDVIQNISITDFPKRVNDFISKNGSLIIASDGFFNVTKDVAKKLVVAHKYKVEPEDLFRAVCKWSEKKAMEKQTSYPNLNLNETIKSEISDFLPHILFRGMDSQFLQQFVVSRGFIFSSLNEVSKIFADRDRFFEGKVKITNANGQMLHGKVIRDKNVLRNIESLKLLTSNGNFGKYCYWNKKCNIFSTQSTITKKEGVEWYLVYDDEMITVQHCSLTYKCDFLLAELSCGTGGFQTTEPCQIEIE